MDAFLHDLRIAARTLARRPAFTGVAAGALSLGLASTIVLFAVVDGVLLRPLPYDDPESLVTLRPPPSDEGGGREGVGWADFEAWREASSFGSVAAWRDGAASLTGLGEPEVLRAAEVSAGFFRVFAAPPLLGRGFAPEETVPGGPAVVVVSHAFWRARLASDPDVLSRTLDLDGRAHQVVGVAPPGFAFPPSSRVWRPVQDPAGCGAPCRSLHVVARLAAAVPLERARREMAAWAGRRGGPAPGGPGAGDDAPVAVVPLHDAVVGEVRTGLLWILAAVGAVLLVACANVANLLSVRGQRRGGDVAVRAAMGAGRSRLVRQSLTESLVLAAAAGGLALLLAAWGLDVVRAVAPADLPRMGGVGIDGRVVAFAAALVAATTLLVGWAPALQRTRLARAGTGTPGSPSGGAGGGLRRGAWGRGTLLAMEVALSVAVLAAAALLFRSSREVARLDAGFDPRGVVAFEVSLPVSRYPGPAERMGFFSTLEERLVRLSRVEAVGSGVGSPLGPEPRRATFRRVGRPLPRPGEEPTAVVRVVTGGYFRTLRIPLLAGRFFHEDDGPGGPPVALVSRAAARRWWPGEDPVGEDVAMGPRPGVPDSILRIVGVVGETRSLALTEEPPPEIYVPYAQAPEPSLTVHVRALAGTGGTGGLATLARGEVRALDPDLPLVRIETLEERIRHATAHPRFHLTLLALFGLVALSLAAVGLYGVVARIVAGRTRELAIRLALGAGEGHVVRLVLRQGLLPALAGWGLGLAGVLVSGRLVEGRLHGVSASDPATLAVATGLVLAVVLGASLLPARRFTRIPRTGALGVEPGGGRSAPPGEDGAASPWGLPGRAGR